MSGAVLGMTYIDPVTQMPSTDRNAARWNAALPPAKTARERLEELSAPFEAAHPRRADGRFTRRRRLRAVA